MHEDDRIKNILATLVVPSLDSSLEEMGIEASLSFQENELKLELHCGFPTLSLEPYLLPLIKKKLQQEYPSCTIHLSFVPFIRAHRTQLPGKGLRNIKNTIAIASGKGGVGKSTVTVNLAIALAQAGASVGILDADIYGPSIPMMLGDVNPVEVSAEHYLPVHAHGIQAMSIGYLTDNNQALIWRGPMLAKSLLQMLDITRWDDLDYLLIDLPPGTGDIQLSLVQKIPLTSAIVVTTPQNIATLDAQKAIQMFTKTGIDVLGILENMSMHTCSACGHQETIFGHGGAQALSEQFQVPLLGQWPLQSQISSESDSGHPIILKPNTPISDTMIKSALLATINLSKKPLNYADKFPPIVVEKI